MNGKSPFGRSPFSYLCWKYRHAMFPGISTKAPCEAAFKGERHVRIEISQNSMRAFFVKRLFVAAHISSFR